MSFDEVVDVVVELENAVMTINNKNDEVVDVVIKLKNLTRLIK